MIREALVVSVGVLTAATLSTGLWAQPTDPKSDNKEAKPETAQTGEPLLMAQAVPEWQAAIEWCRNDEGSIPCEGRILSFAPPCLLAGRRHCLVDTARDAARVLPWPSGCSRAFTVVKICQCHNQRAEDAINQAGELAVCSYLLQH